MKTTRQPRYGDIFAGNDDGAAMAEFARIKWAEYKSDLEERGLWNVTRANTLDRMVRMQAEYEFYYPVALAEGPVKISADGGQYVNMLWSNCQKLNDSISKLEKALMLTPESMGEKAPAKPKGQAASPADKYLARQAAH